MMCVVGRRRADQVVHAIESWYLDLDPGIVHPGSLLGPTCGDLMAAQSGGGTLLD